MSPEKTKFVPKKHPGMHEIASFIYVYIFFFLIFLNCPPPHTLTPSKPKKKKFAAPIEIRWLRLYCHNAYFQGHPMENPFVNIVRKGENADYQHFLLFPKCFFFPNPVNGKLH